MPFEINDEIVERLRTARSVAVLTGTGVAIESGVPTFRQCQTGEWASYTPTELATAQAFLRHPRRVWRWYDYRRKCIESREPGESHYALVDLEQYYFDFTLIAQSIDGLHWRAGSRELIELHGNLNRVRCFDCGDYAAGWDEEGEIPPHCGHCGGWLRPDVVWLGEGIPAHLLRLSYTAAERANVFLSIGTSADVPPAASLPLIAKRAGAFVIEINPNETALAVMADVWLQCKASEMLPLLVQHLTDNLSEREEGM